MSNEICAPVVYNAIKKAVVKGSRKTTDLTKILKVVAITFGVTETELKSKRRYRAIVDARKAFYYICSKHSALANIEAPRLIGQDHSTGIYGLEECYSLMQTNKWYRQKVEDCRYSFIKSYKDVVITYE